MLTLKMSIFYSLREIREHLGYENYQAQQFKPLPDRHPLLQNAAHVRRKPVANPRRHSLTPPKQLPKYLNFSFINFVVSSGILIRCRRIILLCDCKVHIVYFI